MGREGILRRLLGGVGGCLGTVRAKAVHFGSFAGGGVASATSYCYRIAEGSLCL